MCKALMASWLGMQLRGRTPGCRAAEHLQAWQQPLAQVCMAVWHARAVGVYRRSWGGAQAPADALTAAGVVGAGAGCAACAWLPGPCAGSAPAVGARLMKGGPATQHLHLAEQWSWNAAACAQAGCMPVDMQSDPHAAQQRVPRMSEQAGGRTAGRSAAGRGAAELILGRDVWL